MNYWQVSAGYGNGNQRDYADAFLHYGLMLIGPGEGGYYYDDPGYYDDYPRVRWFVEKVMLGDRVLLKKPLGKQWQALAVGTVVGEYEFLPVFDDVDGWNIRHARRVAWYEHLEGPQTVAGMTQGTFFKSHQSPAKEFANRVIDGGHRERKPEVLPRHQHVLTPSELVEAVWNVPDPDRLQQALHQIGEDAKALPRNAGGTLDISEAHALTFFTVPLLEALGWPKTHIRIEHRYVDISLFADASGSAESCVVVVESKKFDGSLGAAAAEQAKAAAENAPRCKTLVVTDGCCYKVYRKTNGEWTYSAYMNVLKPRRSHPYRREIGGGAPEVLEALLPSVRSSL